MDTILELAKFNYIKYFDEPHEYYIDGVKQISATQFLGKFKPKFETNQMAEGYARRRGLDKESVIRDWDFKRDFSTVKGSAFHEYVENWYGNKIFPYNQRIAEQKFGIDVVREAYDKLIDLFDKFYEDSKDNLIPVKSELVVGDREYGICGMVDQLFFNKKHDELQIWDWKTNKKIGTKNDYGEKFLEPLETLDVCELNTYSLQLNLYKHIIEKNTNLKIGKLYICWFHENNKKYEVIQCKDLSEEINQLVKLNKG